MRPRDRPQQRYVEYFEFMVQKAIPYLESVDHPDGSPSSVVRGPLVYTHNLSNRYGVKSIAFLMVLITCAGVNLKISPRKSYVCC